MFYINICFIIVGNAHCLQSTKFKTNIKFNWFKKLTSPCKFVKTFKPICSIQLKIIMKTNNSFIREMEWNIFFLRSFEYQKSFYYTKTNSIQFSQPTNFSFQFFQDAVLVAVQFSFFSSAGGKLNKILQLLFINKIKAEETKWKWKKAKGLHFWKIFYNQL